MNLFFLSSNLQKLEEYKNFLKIDLQHLNVEVDEIQGTKEEVIEHKIKTASKFLSSDSDALLVDDVSFEMDGLYGVPGPYCKDFIKIGIDNICDIGEKVGNKGSAIIYLAFYYKGEINQFKGVNRGTIVPKRLGLNDKYSFDSIFCYNDKTYSEMTMEEKCRSSYRGLACQELLKFFEMQNLQF